MKDNEQKYIYIFTLVSILIIMLNNRFHFIDQIWTFFFLIMSFIANVTQLIKLKKEEKRNEKNINR